MIESERQRDVSACGSGQSERKSGESLTQMAASVGPLSDWYQTARYRALP